VTPRVRNAYGVLERTRIGVGAEHGAIAAQVTLEDARAWGVPVPSGTLGAPGAAPSSTGAYEAWFEVHTSGARGASWLRVGRQAITWGDGRLLSAADWSPVGRSLDAVRAHWTAGIFDAEGFAAMLDTPTPLGPGVGQTSGPSSTGTQLYGAQIAAAFDPLLRVELSALARVARGELTTVSGRFDLARARGETYVGDLRVSGDARGWRYAAEGAYEIGRVELLADASVAAWAAAAYVERRVDALVLSPTFRIGGDYATGDDAGGTYKQFDPILPDVHALHGMLDALAWSNTVQASARVTVEPWTDGRVAVEYRYARLADGAGEWRNAYLGPVGPGRGPEELGHEVDLWAMWRPWPALDLVAGYSIFALGDGAQRILSAESRGAWQPDGTIATSPLEHGAYVQATLRVP
jgi:hypothetical protein